MKEERIYTEIANPRCLCCKKKIKPIKNIYDYHIKIVKDQPVYFCSYECLELHIKNKKSVAIVVD